ncbi:uncharacterized protein CEXT_84711 [Caerostris extrusa]|uniref:Monocarboxylate transporter n=1 Tax=Caerostris extrusa TaxID=172846 RepID=A0AAV4RLZ6_CAEEX|nr:uncharacterized protein CEXT_84711 [Caerostris extrusa]
MYNASQRYRCWTVALICTAINFLLLGTARLSGLMYLAILKRFKVNRNQASFPFVLCYTIRNVASPLIGYLGGRFGIYSVTLWGGVLASAAVGCCFFAEDITTVTVLWGGIFGFGVGMATVLVPEILNQHFDKYIANANGIAFSGECIGGFMLPLLLKFSLNTYCLYGTFLILSGLVLQSIPAALLLIAFSHTKSLNADQCTNDKEKLLNSQTYESDSQFIDEKDFYGSTKSNVLFAPKYDFTSSKREESLIEVEINKLPDGKDAHFYPKKIKRKEQTLPITIGAKSNLITKHLSLIAIGNKEIATRNTQKDPIYDQAEINLNSSDASLVSAEVAMAHSYPKQKKRTGKHALLLETTGFLSSLARSNRRNPCQYYESIEPNLQVVEILTDDQKRLTKSSTESSKRLSVSDINAKNKLVSPSTYCPPKEENAPTFFSSFRLFLDPAFVMILLTQSFVMYNIVMFITVINDFCRDTGLSSNQETTVLLFLSVSDMIGRLGLGWITDIGLMSNTSFSALCCLGMGAAIGSLVFLKLFIEIGFSVAVFGLFFGGFLIVCPGVITDHIPKDERPMALASRFFLFGPMSFSQSPLIYYFRVSGILQICIHYYYSVVHN